MKTRIVLAAFAAISLPALATSGYTPACGEVDDVPHAAMSALSRADVKRELEAWRCNPVTADGWLNVGGEVSTVYVGNAGTGTQARFVGARDRG